MTRLLFAAALTLALTACSKGKGDAQPNPGAKPAAAAPAPTEAAPAAAASPADEAKKIFDTRCAACHGKTGRGDGAAAASLPVKPRDYRDAAWQDSVKDDYLADVIVNGGASVGKSPLMTPNPDLKTKPEVVKEIIKLIRGYKGT